MLKGLLKRQMCFMKEAKMHNSFLLFFYIFSFVLYIPVVILGSFLKPSIKKVKKLPPTPEQILSNIKKDSKRTKKALSDFEELFLDANSCEQNIWLEMIKEFALSPNLQIKEITNFQEKLKQANPSLQNEIALTISVAIKNRK